MKRGGHEFAPAGRIGDNRAGMRMIVGLCCRCDARIAFSLTASHGFATSMCGHAHASWTADSAKWRGMEQVRCYDR